MSKLFVGIKTTLKQTTISVFNENEVYQDFIFFGRSINVKLRVAHTKPEIFRTNLNCEFMLQKMRKIDFNKIECINIMDPRYNALGKEKGSNVKMHNVSMLNAVTADTLAQFVGTEKVHFVSLFTVSQELFSNAIYHQHDLEQKVKTHLGLYVKDSNEAISVMLAIKACRDFIKKDN